MRRCLGDDTTPHPPWASSPLFRGDAVDGCIDIDLNFSPSTNLLPIRRFSPKGGERVAVRAAWLRFPSFKLEPLEQTYSHLADDLYRYESAGGSFVAELRVSAAGFPMDYAGIWRAEATA